LDDYLDDSDDEDLDDSELDEDEDNLDDGWSDYFMSYDYLEYKIISYLERYGNCSEDNWTESESFHYEYQIYLAKTTKNIKPKLKRENYYSNNFNLGNRTYIDQNNEKLNTYFKNDIGNKYEIPKKFKKKNREIKSDFSNEFNKTKNNYIKNKPIICFNNEKNKSFSKESNPKMNEKKIIKNRHINNNKIRNNNKCKNLKNLLFNFERLRQKKFMTRNLSNISINKFINEDGSKDDIRYKISKIKYLSPKINSQKNKINFLFISKNKKPYLAIIINFFIFPDKKKSFVSFI
jgi:hypothetical protein